MDHKLYDLHSTEATMYRNIYYYPKANIILVKHFLIIFYLNFFVEDISK